MAHRALFLIGLGAIGVALRMLHAWLAPFPAPEGLADVPGTMTRGAYWGIATGAFAIYAIHLHRHRTLNGLVGRHALLFLLVGMLSLDFILNNFREADPTTIDLSYSIVAGIDFLVCVLFGTAVYLHPPAIGNDFTLSPLALLLPAIAPLRELAYLDDISRLSGAVVDLLVVSLVAIAWLLTPFPPQRSLTSRFCRFALMSGLGYWALLIVQDSVGRALGFDSEYERMKAAVGGTGNLNLLRLAAGIILGSLPLISRPFRRAFAGACA